MGNKQHPFVFVHGMMGWGEDKKFYKGIPYWGITAEEDATDHTARSAQTPRANG